MIPQHKHFIDTIDIQVSMPTKTHTAERIHRAEIQVEVPDSYDVPEEMTLSELQQAMRHLVYTYSRVRIGTGWYVTRVCLYVRGRGRSITDPPGKVKVDFIVEVEYQVPWTKKQLLKRWWNGLLEKMRAEMTP